jgi:hypothetical protein
VNWDKPNYYMTVDEFAKLVAETVYDCGYFSRDELLHPEDIEAAFTSTATAVAKGATFAIKKINPAKIVFNTNSVTTTKVANSFSEPEKQV